MVAELWLEAMEIGTSMYCYSRADRQMVFSIRVWQSGRTYILEQLGSDLSDTVGGGLQMSSELNGEDGRVGYSEVGCSVYLQVGADDTAERTGQHRTGRRGVVPVIEYELALLARARLSC